MTRRMLINAQRAEQVRVAVVAGSTLENYQVEVSEAGLTRGNIYRGVISNIQPGLNAAFVDYGAERNGFLAIQDVVEQAYYKRPKGKGRPKIEDVLERGKPIVVQVTKEPEGKKGAALTTNLSLAGRYLVLTPFGPSIGISRKVEDDDTRQALRKAVSKLEVPDGCGLIVRTNALEQNKTSLSRDMNALLRLWRRIGSEARKGKGIKLLYSDQDLIIQALRDHLDSSIEEILIDDDEALAKAEQYVRALMPRSKLKLIRYTERAPLFGKFDLESQIESIYERTVPLPSGGSIVIDRTEALTAIDVNSGRGTKGSSQEETAYSTNQEAAREVARQLRLRDIGGLLVVDFIDMRSRGYQRKVEKALKDAMKQDRARHSVGRISSNGLLEINRQRIQQSLSLRTHRACPTCSGTGRIASRDMVGLSLLRRVEARAADGGVKAVRISLHPELADHLQNTRRRQLARLEEEFQMEIEIIAASYLHRPEQEIDWEERDAAAWKASRERRLDEQGESGGRVVEPAAGQGGQGKQSDGAKDGGGRSSGGRDSGGRSSSGKASGGRSSSGKSSGGRSSGDQGGGGRSSSDKSGGGKSSGGRSSGGKSSGGRSSGDQGGGDQGGGDQGDKGGDGGPPKRRRRRRKRSSSGGGSGSGDSGDANQGGGSGSGDSGDANQGGGSGGGRGSKKGGGSSQRGGGQSSDGGQEGGGAPKRRRRRRSRSKGGGSDSGGSSSGGGP